MSDDLRELLSCLKSNEVEFLVVGSHVLAFYGRPRFTEDLDVWVRRTRENGLALKRALNEFGLAFSEQQALDFVAGRNMIRIGAPPNQVDFLAFLGARDNEMSFEVCAERAPTGELFGVSVPFLRKEDFVASKQAAGRPKDVRDIEELKELDR